MISNHQLINLIHIVKKCKLLKKTLTHKNYKVDTHISFKCGDNQLQAKHIAKYTNTLKP